jgi:hypothetical protein
VIRPARVLRPFLLAAAGFLATATAAQDSPYGGSDYGGGWAVPSLDTALMIGREAANKAVMDEIVRKGVARAPQPSAQPRPAQPAPPSPFAAALVSRPGAVPADITRFARSAVLERQSEARILALVGARQGPAAVADYRRVFAQFGGLSAMFRKSVAGYDFRDDDMADTLAAYWLVAWAVVNDVADFTPQQARAVRHQVARGVAASALARHDHAHRQQVSDEAIFNMVVAAQIHALARKGVVSKADYARVGAVTRQAFLGFGTDLGKLALTDAGFRARSSG